MGWFIDAIVSLMDTLGSWGVGIASALETFIPIIPSEVVLPAAGFAASAGKLNFWAAYAAATLGALLGSYVLYWLGAAIGAERLRHLFSRIWLLHPSDVDKSLAWFDKYGRWSVFFGRLVPGIRSLISIPAGVDRMNIASFSAMTLAGSAIWNLILMGLGYKLGDRYELVEQYVGQYSNYLYIAIGVACIGVLVYLVRRSRREKQLANAIEDIRAAKATDAAESSQDRDVT